MLGAVLSLAAVACGGATSGVSLEPDDRVLEMRLDGDACQEEDPSRQWMEVLDAGLEDGRTLLVRVRSSPCTESYVACATGTVIDTDPALWEMTIDARGPRPARAFCARRGRTRVLRVSLAGNMLPQEGLARVRGVHEFPTSTSEERKPYGGRLDPRPWKIDIEVAP